MKNANYLLKSPILQRWGKLKSDLESVSTTNHFLQSYITLSASIILPTAITRTELSYHKQIMCQLRTQYAEGIYSPKYYTVILKSRLRSLETEPLDISYTTYNKLVDLFDIEY